MSEENKVVVDRLTQAFNDGNLDALVGIQGGTALWINQGSQQSGQAGRFAGKKQSPGGDQTRSVRLGDLDGDGDLDALVVGRRKAEIWWNDGLARYTRAAQSIPCSSREDLATGDFNGDGSLDLFIAGYDASAQVWLNDGKGGFAR